MIVNHVRHTSGNHVDMQKTKLTVKQAIMHLKRKLIDDKGKREYLIESIFMIYFKATMTL